MKKNSNNNSVYEKIITALKSRKEKLIEWDKAADNFANTGRIAKENTIEKFINNEVKAAEYINRLLNTIGLKNIQINKDEVKESITDRYSHTLFTFLLGLLICKFNNLEEKIENHYKKYFDNQEDVFLKVWIFTAIFHDIGYVYIRKNNARGITKLSEINANNNIFDYKEGNEKTRYSQDLFENYFSAYAKSKTLETEYLEHGITGGYVLFNKLLESKIKLEGVKENYLYQNICYRIMEHNIWKITDDAFFKDFNKQLFREISEDNFTKIDDSEPLLFLLALCDSIEHVKRLWTANKNNGERNTRVLTFAKKIEIDVTEESIIISYNNVKDALGFERWKSGIEGLSAWLNVKYKDENNQWEITIDKK